MSNGVAKKLTLALYLNPETSEADRYAVGALQQWYDKAKKSHALASDLDMVIRLFHRDIYLAGLYLHLLSPRLCRGIAGALDNHNITLATLKQQLDACGLELPLAPQGDNGFSAAQLAQLQQLLMATPAEGSPPTPTLNLEAALAEQHALLALMSEELSQLRALAETQAEQLTRLKLGNLRTQSADASRQDQTEESSLSELAPHLAQIQQIKKKGLF